jgi:hypothetical protein
VRAGVALGTSPIVTEAFSPTELNVDLAYVRKDLYGETASPTCGKQIAFLLSRTDTWDKIKKVKKYLRNKPKKSRTTRKTPKAA